MSESVTYLGHRIDSQGVHPVEEKVKALLEVPIPKNTTALKSFLGMLSYYSKFLPNLSSELAPLYQLLKHSIPCQWTVKQQQVFDKSKELLASSQVLVHFDSKLQIRLACDASDYGIGAVLSLIMPDGLEKPVGFVCPEPLQMLRKNTPSWKKKVWHVCMVSNVHKFVLQTDHQPLITLFNEAKVVPAQASNHIQRWPLLLASYEYTISYRLVLF